MSEECKVPKPEDVSSTLEIKSDSDSLMFFDPIEIGFDNLAEDENIQIDKNEFIRGLKDSSYACGIYTGLINVGFSQEDAIAYLFNRMNIENNIAVSKISANGSIEVSKNVSSTKEHQEL